MGWTSRALHAALSGVLIFGLGGCARNTAPNGPSNDDATQPVEPLPMIHTEGTRWVDANGQEVLLKGVNLGNWLLQEFWMMGQSTEAVNDQCTLEALLIERFGVSEKERLMTLFRDHWMTERDWDLLASFGFNVVRLPFIYHLLEDEETPYTLREDAWVRLDEALREAEARGMYVILDLHGVVGSQWDQHTTGCEGQNDYWTNAEYQGRTLWLWQQIAARYKDTPTVAGYSLVNEPWGTTADNMASVMLDLYDAVRAVDPNHTIILPGHNTGIDAYGAPRDRGLENVAFEMHFYPGYFGWGSVGLAVHDQWLHCLDGPNSGVCGWDQRLKDRDAAFLVGEFQPWAGLGEQGGAVARATYDTYAQYGWASTAWAYKVVTNSGGEGAGTWGVVTNAARGFDEHLVAANTWDCRGWDSSFADACARRQVQFTVQDSGTYYFVMKVGAFVRHDVTVDELRLVHEATGDEVLTNGGFGSDTGWSEFVVNGTQTVAYNNTSNPPAGAMGAGLRITGGAANGGIYQSVALTAGETYTVAGVFKDNGSADAWAELFLVRSAPEDGTDVLSTPIVPQLDFETASLSDIEALFTSFSSMEYDVHEGVRDALLAETPTDPFN